MDQFIYETKFTDDICDGIIDFYNTSDQFQKHSGQISGGGKDAAKSEKDSIDLSIPWHFIEFDQRLDAYFNFLHQAFVSYFQKFEQSRLPCKISDVFNIQWYPKGGGYKIWHFERTNNKHAIRRHLVWMTYLTDNPNGGTEFYFQDLHIPAEKGKTVIWPAEWMYTHKGRVDHENEKMIITGWLEFTQKGMGELT